MDLNVILENMLSNKATQKEYETIVELACYKLKEYYRKNMIPEFLSHEDKLDMIHMSIALFTNNFNAELGFKPSTLFFTILFREVDKCNMESQDIYNNELLTFDNEPFEVA